jgi:hypothetical protein
MYYTPETLLNHVFEDLRKTKAPNKLILLVVRLLLDHPLFTWGVYISQE